MASLPAFAEAPVVLAELVVVGKTLVTPTKQSNETVHAASEITREGLEALGMKGIVSVYEATCVLPGVSVESVDPYRLAAERKNSCIRGARVFLGDMTVSGVPNYDDNSTGPLEYICDVENFESLTRSTSRSSMGRMTAGQVIPAIMSACRLLLC